MAKKEQTLAASTSEVPSGFKIRGQQKTYHHLFKAMLGKFMKNISWKKGSPNLQNIEHVHYFHSVNSLGMKQQFTTTVGGHFHKVDWKIDEKTGEPVAVCGPAMKKIVKAQEDGSQKTSIVPCRFFAGKQINEDTGEERERWITDDHKHDMVYQGTDELTADMVRGNQEGTAKVTIAIEPPKVDGFADGDR